MSEENLEHGAQDQTSVSDQVQVDQPNPYIAKDESGEVVFAGGVKGPDPEVWGDPADRPDPFAADPSAPKELPEGTKGPDPEVWG